MSQRPFNQQFPQPGWVEHNPLEIWSTQSFVMENVVNKADIEWSDIEALGITNQRETTVVWDRQTSEPVYNAIVWQDRRTADYCDVLRERGLTERIREKTGLILDAYFSATKIRWILDNVPGARARAERGELCFGTVDSWLAWRLSGGRLHINDVSNASRTMLFDIHTLDWDDELLDLFDIPRSMLPEVVPTSAVYGTTDCPQVPVPIPIASLAGDQQAALFGQQCIAPFSAKTTYGTGCFIMLNTGDRPHASANNLLATVAWQLGGKTTYARMIGQILYFAKMGLLVPCEKAGVPNYTTILSHFSNDESEMSGKGKLVEELTRLKPMMQEKWSGSFVILNELFTTAATWDAGIMGQKVLDYFMSHDCYGIYVTHIQSLAKERDGLVSLVAELADDHHTRSFKITRKPASEAEYEDSLITKYNMTENQMKAVIGHED